MCVSIDHFRNTLLCEVGTVNKVSDYQQGSPGFNFWPGRGLNFGRPSFATPSDNSASLIYMLYFVKLLTNIAIKSHKNRKALITVKRTFCEL